MPIIKTIRGNLIREFLNPNGKVLHMAHGTNCKGFMGAGIADQVRIHVPDAYRAYKASPMTPGGYSKGCSPLDPNRFCYNLNTQIFPGPDARLSLVAEAFGAINEQETDLHGKILGVPLIGCGIGGLEWDKVSAVIHRTATNFDVVVVIYEAELNESA